MEGRENCHEEEEVEKTDEEVMVECIECQRDAPVPEKCTELRGINLTTLKGL